MTPSVRRTTWPRRASLSCNSEQFLKQCAKKFEELELSFQKTMENRIGGMREKMEERSNFGDVDQR